MLSTAGFESRRLTKTESQSVAQALKLPQIYASPSDPLMWPPRSAPASVGLDMMAMFPPNGASGFKPRPGLIGFKTIDGQTYMLFADGSMEMEKPNPSPPAPETLPPIREWHQVGGWHLLGSGG
jgi:hypothetical protein